MAYWDGTRWHAVEPARQREQLHTGQGGGRRRVVDWIATLLIIMALPFAFVPFRDAHGGTPSIEVLPTSGHAGSAAAVTGHGFRPFESVQLKWDHKGKGMPKVTADASGGLSVSVTIPASASAGTHVISAVGPGVPEGSEPIETNFEVMATDAAPAHQHPNKRPKPSASPTPSIEPTASPSPVTPEPTPTASESPVVDLSPTPSASAAPSEAAVEPTAAPAADGIVVVRAGENLGAIANDAPAGAVVVVESGTYAPFTVTRSDVTIRSAPGHSVVVSGGVNAIEVVGVARVTLENLVVRDAREYGIDIRDSTDVRVHGVVATKNGTGIRVFGWNSKNVHVTAAWLHHNDKMIRNTCGGNDDFGANAIKWRDTSGPHSITGSLIHNHRANSCDYGVDGGAFELFNAGGVTIANNEAYDNNVVYEIGAQVGYAPGKIMVRDNHFWNPDSGGVNKGFMIRGGTDSIFSGNRIENLDWWAFYIRNCTGTFCSPIGGTRIEGNTVNGVTAYKVTETLPTSVVIDHNDASHAAGRVVAEYLGTKYTNHCTFSGASGYDRSSACD